VGGGGDYSREDTAGKKALREQDSKGGIYSHREKHDERKAVKGKSIRGRDEKECGKSLIQSRGLKMAENSKRGGRPDKLVELAGKMVRLRSKDASERKEIQFESDQKTKTGKRKGESSFIGRENLTKRA